MLRRMLALSAVLPALILVGGCTNLNRIDEEEAIDHYVAGQELADKGEYDTALKELAEAVENNPSLSVAYSAMGDIHRKQGNHTLAARDYGKACDANPYSFTPHYKLARTYQLLADKSTIVKRAEEYLRKAVDTYLRAVALKPDDYEANLNIAACYFQLRRFEMAVQYCRAAIKADNSKPGAYSNLGIIYDTQGEFYKAIAAYKDSLELDRHQPQILMNLGSTYARQGRLKAAIDAYKIAAQESPDQADPWEEIGSAYYQLEEYDQAKQAYEKAIQLDASSPLAHRGLGVVLMTEYLLGQKTDEDLRRRALQQWNLSLEEEPDQPDLVKLVKKYQPKVAPPEL
ncbi:MAG: tetratricopeptide repeat protein [Phycisphaerae bacterium]